MERIVIFTLSMYLTCLMRSAFAESILPGSDLEEGPEDQTVLAGERALFNCDLEDSNEKTVLWYSAQTQSYITRKDVVRNPILRDRFSILVNFTTQSYLLIIDDVQESDAGTYECAYLLGLRAKTLATAHLVVVPAPATKPICGITYLPDMATSWQGQVVDVSCSWESSHPKVIATLFRNDSKLTPDVYLDHRIVTRVYLGDQGSNVVFRCDIKLPELGWMSSCSMEAQGHPSLKVGILPLISRTKADSAVSLDCYGQSDGAAPEYSWVVPSNESYQLSEVFHSERNYTSLKLDGLGLKEKTVVVECRVSTKDGRTASSIAVVDVEPTYHPLNSSRVVISLLAGLMLLLLIVIITSCFVCSSRKSSKSSYDQLLSSKKGKGPSIVYDTVAKYYQDGHLSLNLDSPPSSPLQPLAAAAQLPPDPEELATISPKRSGSTRSAMYTKPVSLPKKLSRSGNKSTTKTQLGKKTARSISVGSTSSPDTNVLYENLPRTGSMSSLYSRLSTDSHASMTSMTSLNESLPRGVDLTSTDNDREPILKHSYIGMLQTNRFAEDDDDDDDDAHDYEGIDVATSSKLTRKTKVRSKPVQYVELDLQAKTPKPRKSKKKPKVKWADNGVVYTELNI